MSKMICVCNRVTDRAIKKLVVKYPAISPDEVIRITGASSTCGRCRNELMAFLRELNASGHSFHKDGQLLIPFPAPDQLHQNDNHS